MKVTLNRDGFYNLLELVGRISTKHITLPVLQCVLIEAREDNKVVLRATNLEIAIEAVLDAEVGEVGKVAVPASILLQTVNLINQKSISLRFTENSLEVDGNGSKTQIKSIPHEEFPSIPQVSGTGQVINGALFSLGIKSTAFAASLSSIKPELGSVNVFQKKEHTLTFVSTDSFRLFEKTVPQKSVVLDDAILIPQKNALEIARVCDVVGGDPRMKVNDHQLALEFESGVTITSRLVAGTFPDYEQIIPKEYSTHTTLLKEDLLHAFKKTNIFLNKFFQVGLSFNKDSVTVSAGNNDVGNTTESIRASTDGEDLSLNFNQRYISEALPHLSDDSIVIHLSGIGRPMVIKGVNDMSVRYLVMPMNK
ncbi:DNA polymerase III subunit beta [Candidatus Kaiserbacteria bacterium RIFOXYB1_FULL_46_14]|uniref:Beta sliding clamp n=1 Tax=Candidatus Kaiserbacteria bacterium RIFOXYB1_FULL_46_14 TaxID=1798531 RepID=A0A1F6FI86_9BACT|nr:MAG: DNA polymerase III subunit beta [Candidatus Kaiserbacteria bacterium RIFOXYB1_FULL_46_14]